jgi:DNA-binding response OmpR family regulator
MSDRVLIIDDDEELSALVAEYLGAERFEVDLARDGDQGLAMALAGAYDLVILDVMLPGINGFDVLRRLREASAVPVVMLTARGQDVDRIVGLEIGADDYLSKPFNSRELVARIRAVLRRTGRSGEPAASVAIPPHWGALVAEDPAAARAELLRVRGEFQEAFAAGLVCAGFERDPSRPRYLFYSDE